MMKIQFMHLGREGFNEVVEIPEGSDTQTIINNVVNEASKHLLSHSIDADYDLITRKGVVIVGGWRPVGEFIIS